MLRKDQSASSPFDAVLFDLGGTLFEPLPAEYTRQNLQRVAERVHAGNQSERFIRLYSRLRSEAEHDFSSRAFYRHRDLVSATLVNSLQAIGARRSEGDSVVVEFCNAQRDCVITHLQPRPDCFSTLRQLRLLDQRIGIVSNIDDDYLTPIVAKWGLADLVDFSLSSEAARSCKPDRQIFALAAERTGVVPSRTLFVGDSAVHDVHGADNFGMRGVLFVDAAGAAASSAVANSVASLWEVTAMVAPS